MPILAAQDIRALASSISKSVIQTNLLAEDLYKSGTQEPPITARLGADLERMFDDLQVGNARVRAVTFDIPSHGPNALEKRVGADIYIGFIISNGEDVISKGLLVQAKKLHSAKPGRMTKKERDKLQSECEFMLSVSAHSCVWLYHNDGVMVIPAKDVVRTLKKDNNLTTAFDEGRLNDKGLDIGGLLETTLECTFGDEALGVPVDTLHRSKSDQRKALAEQLRSLNTPVGVSLYVEGPKPTLDMPGPSI